MKNRSMIIVTDDDYSDRYLIKTAFEDAGFDLEISEYEDGAQLIDYFNEGCHTNPPSLILLDINMPKKTGMDVLEYLKNNPSVCPVPVIIFSTSGDQRDISRSKELGATDYIVKPGDYDGYLEVVKRLIGYLGVE